LVMSKLKPRLRYHSVNTLLSAKVTMACMLAVSELGGQVEYISLDATFLM